MDVYVCRETEAYAEGTTLVVCSSLESAKAFFKELSHGFELEWKESSDIGHTTGSWYASRKNGYDYYEIERFTMDARMMGYHGDYYHHDYASYLERTKGNGQS